MSNYKKEKKYLIIIFVISFLATLGSLYIWYRGDPFLNAQSGIWFNKLNGIPACDLCWYMRVFQYPLLFISWIALYTHDKKSIQYIWPLAVWGLLISLYKIALEQSWIAESSLCTSPVSCSKQTLLGWFISLPLLGALAFWIILCVCFLTYRAHKK